jgi:hypothetical protein
VSVKPPQPHDTEGPYRSRLMGSLDGNSEVLERLVVEMDARALCTREVEDCFRDEPGELLISSAR